MIDAYAEEKLSKGLGVAGITSIFAAAVNAAVAHGTYMPMFDAAATGMAGAGLLNILAYANPYYSENTAKGAAIGGLAAIGVGSFALIAKIF